MLYFYYVVNLASADILVGIVVEPLNVSVYWTESEPALFVFYLFSVLSCVSSILNVSDMMLDRYIAVRQAFRYRALVTVKRIRASIVFLWLYAFHFSLLAFLGWCNESFLIYLYAFGVFLPSVMMLASYHGLTRVLKKKGSKLKRFSFGRQLQKRKSGAKRASNLYHSPDNVNGVSRCLVSIRRGGFCSCMLHALPIPRSPYHLISGVSLLWN